MMHFFSKTCSCNCSKLVLFFPSSGIYSFFFTNPHCLDSLIPVLVLLFQRLWTSVVNFCGLVFQMLLLTDSYFHLLLWIGFVEKATPHIDVSVALLILNVILFPYLWTESVIYALFLHVTGTDWLTLYMYTAKWLRVIGCVDAHMQTDACVYKGVLKQNMHDINLFMPSLTLVLVRPPDPLVGKAYIR